MCEHVWPQIRKKFRAITFLIYAHISEITDLFIDMSGQTLFEVYSKTNLEAEIVVFKAFKFNIQSWSA